ncbi:MAG: hypothetical protein KIT31_12290 [Deltaproteobacteria bacterium]|nr:hypothetical protein [Deltaproteobacteria bacterium]
MLREAKKKVVAQASGPPDPKAAHAASDKESIEAARATLNAQAAIVVEAAALIETALHASGADWYARENQVHMQLARGRRAIDDVSLYCIGIKLGANGWSELSQRVTGVYRAFERFEAAMESAYPTFQISRSGNQNTHFMRQTLESALQTIGHGKVMASYVGKPPTESSSTLLVIDVRENLEAARAAASSVSAGNKAELGRLVRHLAHLAQEDPGRLKLLKAGNKAEFDKLLGLRTDVLHHLDKLEPAGLFAASEHDRYVVDKFRRFAR